MATMSLQAAYDQARNYLEANQVPQAMGVAQHVLAHFPENLEAYRILGEAYLAERQFDQAEEAFRRVLRADPESVPAHVGLGITFERQGRIEQAVMEFEQALEVRPDMPELRGQLLRLYTDVWGSEGASLRLSRPGLARLYAKGHMLTQAIQEFRGVMDEFPDRFDVRIGLAEALWRDGQIDAAVETCEDILAERPEVLKANLLLGYIWLAGNDDRGLPYWQFAQQLDPYQQVAQTLFETLPDLPGPDFELAAWDEQAWFAQTYGPTSPTAAPAAAPDLMADDFLASLLALTPPSPTVEMVSPPQDVAPTVVPAPPTLPVEVVPSEPVEPQLEPFSLADLGLPTDQLAALEPATPATEPPLEAFSLADLGLSADELAELERTTSAAEAQLEPLSLADLGLSAEELALLEAEPQPPEAELQPFSLADLGLDAPPDEGVFASLPPALQPFALDELPPVAPPAADALAAEQDEQRGFSWQQPAPQEHPGFLQTASVEPDQESIFDRLRQRAAEYPPLEAPPLMPISDAELAAMTYFSDDTVSLREEVPGAPEPLTGEFRLPRKGGEAPESVTLPVSPRPSAPDEFSFVPDDLGLSSNEIAMLDIESILAQSEGGVAGSIGDLQPFSLADLNLDEFGGLGEPARELGVTEEELAALDLGRLEPQAGAVTATPPTDGTLEQLLSLGHRQGFVDLSDIIALLPHPEAEHERIEQLGWALHHAGIEIRDGAEVVQMEEQPEPVVAAEPELVPFSLAELGLTPEEIALLEETARAEMEPIPTLLTEAVAAELPSEVSGKQGAPAIMAPQPEAVPLERFVPEPLDQLDDIWTMPEPVAPPPVPAPPVAPAEPAGRGLTSDLGREISARPEPELQRAVSYPAGGEFAPFLPTGNRMLDAYLEQLDLELDNYGLALAVGNLCARTGQSEIMALAFKRLVRAGQGIEQLVALLESLRGEVSEPVMRMALLRLLGDAYSKQGRYTEAMNAYNATFA